ncbi:MAG: S8 family serine peptidase [Planctomycetota bacterium]|nr:S8 family serine peptidase [Planctomycetota bacterium]
MQKSLFTRSSVSALLLVAAAGTAAATVGTAPVVSGESQGPAVAQAAGQGQVVFVEIPGSMEFSGEIIAKPLQFETLAERGMNQAEISATIQQAKAMLAQFVELEYEPLVDHYVLLVPNGMTENEVINGLISTGLFEFVEPNWTLYPIANCPNDPRLGNQWHHNANRMQSCDAWDLDTGNSSVTVGICDTGIETSHSDFQLHRKEGYNAVNRVWENDGGNIGPVHPHGTNTTGCAAANGDNGVGVSGVGWNLSHRMMRVSNTSSGSSSLSTLTHAALTSIQAGDKVANVSYSGVNTSSVRSTATQIKNLGGLLTWAAGNDGSTLNWGNRDNDDVIVVGATTSSDNISSFSARGPSVDLMAPGSSVHTTNTGNSYASVSGTSFSAPLTAGLIGLIWSSNPGLTPDEVEDILKAGCDDLGAGGVDNTYGYGRINSYESLLLAGGMANTPPVITINSPANFSSFAEGTPVTFDSTTIDAEDGDISNLVTWTSTQDGLLGTGNFTTSAMTEGLHFIDVSVTDSGGLSDFELLSVTITAGGGVPAVPTINSALEGPAGKMNVVWTDNSNNETGFGIQRQEKVNGSWTNRTDLGPAAANDELFVDTIAESLNGWRYRVRAEGAGGDSAWTPYKPIKPKRPVNFSGTVNGGSVDMIWTDRSNMETGIEVYRQEYKFVNGRFRWQAKVLIATLPPNTESYSDAPGAGEWRYKLRLTSETLRSEFSTNVRVIVP